MSRTIRSSSTTRYAFDDANRLTVRERDDATGVLLPPQILEGRVTTQGRNRLVYEVESFPQRADGAAPRAIQLDGTWKLTAAHELALLLHADERRARQTVYLKGALVRAAANSLTFALRHRADDEQRTAQQVTLSGRWQADAKNRLTFLAEKADGAEDRLTLQGGWSVGPRHELVYRYRQQDAPDRSAGEHALTFEGAWEIAQADRLVYRLSGSSDSAFEFRVALQSPSLLAREGRITYQVGIGLAGGRTQRRQVVLFGAWKLNRDLSVSFEIPYAGGRTGTMRFEGTYALSSRDRIAVALQDSRREGLGLTVTFTKETVPDANLFLKLRSGAQERSVLGGVQVRF